MTADVESRVLSWATSVDDAVNRFDIVDRVVVFIFMVVTMMLLIFVLAQNLTPAEQAEIAPVINAMAYLPLFFLVWPLIQTVLTKAVTYTINRWGKESGSA